VRNGPTLTIADTRIAACSAAVRAALANRRGECSERRYGRAAADRRAALRRRDQPSAGEAGALGLSAPCTRLMSQHCSRLDRGIAPGDSTWRSLGSIGTSSAARLRSATVLSSNAIRSDIAWVVFARLLTFAGFEGSTNRSSSGEGAGISLSQARVQGSEQHPGRVRQRLRDREFSARLDFRTRHCRPPTLTTLTSNSTVSSSGNNLRRH
jgi:hypothetical protein